MADPQSPCPLCLGAAADERYERVQVWEDALWRLIMRLNGPVPAYSNLVPKRHIPHITDLDGAEAATLGAVLARVTTALRAETDADLVYLHIVGGGVPHLHIHLAPHRRGDALNDQVIRGTTRFERLPGGADRITSDEFPSLSADEHRAVAERLTRRRAAP